MEMWRKDKNYSFCMKYAVISWAIPLESQAGIKAWDWREPQNHAAQPMHSDHNPQGPAEEWLCSTHCSAMRDEYTPCEEQTHWCGDFIKAPAAWRSSLQNLNLSGDFSCFQSSACFFHLGYWLKGAEKCSTDNRWSIFKKYHCCVESPGIWRFQTGAPLDIQCWKMRLDRRQQNDLLSSWTYFTACQSATLNEREKKTFVMWTWVEIFWSTLFFFTLAAGKPGNFFQRALENPVWVVRLKVRTVKHTCASFIVGFAGRRGKLNLHCKIRLITGEMQRQERRESLKEPAVGLWGQVWVLQMETSRAGREQDPVHHSVLHRTARNDNL